MCICDSTAITCGKVMFHRDKYIQEYNTYKYIKCLLYRYALNVCTESEEHIALNKMIVELVSSADTRGKKCQKEKKTCVKITCELQMFSNRDCVMGEYFSAFIFK